MKRFFLLSGIFLFISSCSHKAENIERAFYYWKNDTWHLEDGEKKIANDLQIKKLYVKFFEVDYSDEMGCFPIAKQRLHCRYTGLDSCAVVPTVYLKNNVFLKSSKEDLNMLADNVNFLIDKYCRENFSHAKPITEFQMDCDWTLKTKDNYFYFLTKLKEISKKELSCTLRLYPYKYPDKMGIPPVEKVMLMCYNLLNPLENKNKNSILDLDELKSYLNTSTEYPKHIDIALPVYSWLQVYHNEQFSKVIYAAKSQVEDILKQDKPMWYTVIKDTVVADTYLRVGDKIKYEEINADKVNGAITLLKKHVGFDKNITIALFHLDENQLSNFTHEELSNFYTYFNK